MKGTKMGLRTMVRYVSYLTASFVVLAGLAIQGQREAAAYRQYLALSRLHAFSELSANLSQLDTDLQKGVYASSPAMLSALCTQIFGRALSAQMALGELPYASVELEQTAAFLAKTGDYAAALARSAVAGDSCTQEQRETLRALSQTASTLSGEVSALQAQLLDGTAELDDVETAEARMAAREGQGQEVAGTVYQTVEEDFPEIPTLIYDGPFSDHITDRAPRMLEGLPEVTQEEARAAAAAFLDLKPEIFTLVSSGEGQVPTYSFSAAVDGGELYVEVTRQGGLVLEVLHSRTAGAPSLSRQDAAALAKTFLEERGYPNMQESYYLEHDGMLTVNFAAAQGEVLCYPDLVKVTIALDTGRVVGFEAAGYLMNHTEQRDLPAPAVSAEQARVRLAEGLTVLSQRLAVIPTSGEYELLCHEFKCQDTDGRHVLIYVNVQTGQEERIFILLEDENGTLVL